VKGASGSPTFDWLGPMFETLPIELSIEICDYLSSHDLCSVIEVCKIWHKLLNTEYLMELLSTKKWSRKYCNIEKYCNSWKILCKNDNLRNKCTMWSWDPYKCGSGIELLGFNKVAKFDEASANSNSTACQVLCKQPCIYPERYYFELEVIASCRGSLNIGLSGTASANGLEAGVDLEHRCGFDRRGFSYSLFSKTIFHNNDWIECENQTSVMDIDDNDKGAAVESESDSDIEMNPVIVGVGTRIGMGVDMNRKTLSFFRDGLLEVHLNLSSLNNWLSYCDKFYPSISIGDSGDCVAIIDQPTIPKF